MAVRVSGPIGRLLADEGQTLVEYALLMALVGLATFGVLTSAAKNLHTAYDGWGRALDRIWDMPPPRSSP